MTAPIWPKAIASWTDRINNTDIVWASDPNQLAAEILSLETTVGTMPQTEPSPPVGQPVTYKTMSARVTDSMLGNQRPYCSLAVSAVNVGYGSGPGESTYVSYRKLYDPYGYFNGSDVTIRATGLYTVDAYQSWTWYNAGYLSMYLIINGTICRNSLWSWKWFNSGTAKGSYTDDRFAVTNLSWIGGLKKGDRVRIGLENGTPRNPYRTFNGSLKVFYERQLPVIGDAPGTGQPE